MPLTFAGLWERRGPDKLLSCTIVTTEASDGIRDLHNRMPVMLAPHGIDAWLSGGDPVVDAGIDEAVSVLPVSPKNEFAALQSAGLCGSVGGTCVSGPSLFQTRHKHGEQ